MAIITRWSITSSLNGYDRVKIKACPNIRIKNIYKLSFNKFQVLQASQQLMATATLEKDTSATFQIVPLSS
jgi:hypothetical protein